MVTGINHITLAVSNVEASFDFYVSVVALKPKVKWDSGAYLSAGGFWFCISLDHVSPAQDYTHVCFTVAAGEFESYRSRLQSAGVQTWKENSSEGDSFYFLDPDGHKLEVHVGSLESRLEALKLKPYKGLEWFN